MATAIQEALIDAAIHGAEAVTFRTCVGLCMSMAELEQSPAGKSALQRFAATLELVAIKAGEKWESPDADRS
jgi:hypothetical protein